MLRYLERSIYLSEKIKEIAIIFLFTQNYEVYSNEAKS